MAIMDTVVIANILPIIATDLGATSQQAWWAGSSYLVTQALCQPLFGSISEILGRKMCFIDALLTFTTGSLLCAMAQYPGWLICSRAVSSSLPNPSSNRQSSCCYAMPLEAQRKKK
jgi:MFS family permease